MRVSKFTICFFLFPFLAFNSISFAASTMTLEVKGKITQGGNPVGAGYKVSITNTRSNRTMTTTTPSANGPGTYANAWVDFLNPVAKTGDIIRVEVKSTDGQETLNTATATYSSGTSITINLSIPVAVANPPQASDQTIVTAEDTSVSIALVATDADGDSLTYSVVSNPSQGQLSGTVPNLTYTPKSNFNGSDSLTFKANDGSADSNTATVTVTVSAVNDAPVVIPQVVTTSQNAAKSITLVGMDVDNDNGSLTFAIGMAPKNGILSSISGATVTYTPNQGFSGGDNFTFKANDGTVNSQTATVTIVVTAINEVPMATGLTVTVVGDSSNNAVTLSGSDNDGDNLTYTLVSNPSHGTLAGTPPNLTYTPKSGFTGQDSFTFKVNDGKSDSNIATVSITVTAVNNAPVARDQSVTTDEDTAKSITLSASDVDADTLIYAVANQPSTGVLTGTAPNLIYTPKSNFSGQDSFTFRVNDGNLDSTAATVTITITAVNDAPVATGQSVSVAEDSSNNAITLSGSDTEGDDLIYALVSNPSHGTLSGTAPNLTYTPKSNFSGQDSFTFKVNDGNLDSTDATVTITITAVNDAPVVIPQVVTTSEGVAKTVNLVGMDADNENSSLTYKIGQLPKNGTLSEISGVTVTYTPKSGFSGGDNFTFQASDGALDSQAATVTIVVTAINNAPVAVAQSVTVVEDSSNNAITLSGSDSEGDNLTYTLVTNPSQGTLSGTAPNLTYTPKSNFSGQDGFIFKVNDGNLDSTAATVTITITAVNDAPVATGQSVTVVEDSSNNAITLSGGDTEGGNLIYALVSNPSQGTLSGTAPNLTYTPKSNFSGQDSFTFKVNDGSLDSAVVTVNLTIKAKPRPSLSLDVNQIDFQQVSLGSQKSLKLKVSNTGSAPLNVTSLSLDNDSVTVDMTAPFNLGQNQQKILTITFKPTVETAISAKLKLISNAGQREITLTGSGFIPPAQLILSENQIQFPSTYTGEISEQELTISNTGGKTLVISSIDSNKSTFTVTPSKLEIDPGESEVLALQFQPTQVGAQKGQLTFESNVGLYTVQLSAQAETTPPKLMVSVDNLDFGLLEQMGAKKIILDLNNTGGSQLEISSVDVTPNQPFALATDKQIVIAGNQSEPLEIVFQPETDGVFSAKLVLVSNGGQSTVQLKGERSLLPPVADQVQLLVDPIQLPANGISQSSVVILVTANDGREVKDESIQLTASQGEVESPVTYIDGGYRATYTAGSGAGQVVIKAETQNSKSAEVFVTLTPRALSREESSLASDKPLVLADGEDQAILTVTVFDQQGLAWPDQKVELSVEPDNSTFFHPYPAQTDADGKVVAGLSSIVKGDKTVRAKIGNTPLLTELKLIFVSAQPSNSQIKASPTATVGQAIQASIELKNEEGTPIVGKQVKLIVSPSQGVQFPDGQIMVTDEKGLAQVSFQSTLAGLKVLTAKVGEQIIDASKVVLLVPDVLDRVNLQSDPQEVEVGRTSQITAVFSDQFGNPVDVLADQLILQTDQGQLSAPIQIGSGRFSFNLTPPDEAVDITVSATVGEVTKSLVLKSKLSTFEIAPPTAELWIGNSIQFFVFPQQPVVWSVGGDIGVIDQKGIFKGEKAGEGRIVAKLETDPTIVATSKLIQVKGVSTFSLSALKSSFEVQTGGGRAFYLIQLEAEAEFDSEVSLRVTDLPSGLKAEITPTDVILDGNDSILKQVDAQLLLDLPSDLAEGNYQFSLLAIPNQGQSQELSLELKVIAAKVAPTYLFLFLPKSIAFGDDLEVNGQLEADTQQKLNQLKVNLSLVAPDDARYEFEAALDEEGKYIVSPRQPLDQIGRWIVEAGFKGNSLLKKSKRVGALEVIAGASQISFESGNSGKLGVDYQLIGYLDPQLEGTELTLKVVAPDQSAATPTTLTTGKFGVFSYNLPASQVGEWFLTITWAGNEQFQPVNRTHAIQVKREFGKVIMVLAGVDPEVDYEWRVFNSVMKKVYRTFLQRSFDSEEDLYLLSPDPNRSEGADAETTLNSLEFAITSWAGKRVNENVPLYIYLLSHNLGDQFLLEKHRDRQIYLTPTILSSWLDTLAEQTSITLIIESCYSGNFITEPLISPNRTIITSARSDRQAKIMRSSSFSKIFFDQISLNQTVSDAFEKSTEWMKRHSLHRGQNPQLDADGNGITNEIYDYRALGERRIPDDIVSLASPPEFITVSPPSEIPVDSPPYTLEAELIGQEIDRVFVSIVTPDYQPDQEISDWQQLEQLVVELELIEATEKNRANTHFFHGQYQQFGQLGEYTIIFQAENRDGSALPVKTSVTVAIEELVADANGDGTVNIFDLVLVAGQFGQSGENLSGDVNKDGLINIFDLVVVAGSFGQSAMAAAPSMIEEVLPTTHWQLTMLQKRQIAKAINRLKSNSHLSLAEELVFNLLQAILSERSLAQTQLLQNYPNPFNPETWIPFQLQQEANVVVDIYQSNGQRVRRLDLGWQEAGYYTTTQSAAYWDGRTELGEQVPSGLYFYTIRAGQYSQTRRMVILK
ncbi:MAG: Ig-like domain-containing protein [Candidatus Poribacteria bacterium]|nr:Ig-like domain-containing protein [Candidatus Poribacteria bacterium]